MGKHEVIDSDDGQNYRKVQFFWVQAGKQYKQIFNLNCPCSMLLDAIKKHCLPRISQLLVQRLQEIKTELQTLTRHQAEHLVKEQEDAKAEVEAAAVLLAGEGEHDVSVAGKGKGKAAAKSKGPSKEEKEQEKKKLEAKQAEGVAKAALETTKSELIEEEQVLFQQLSHVKKIKEIDLTKPDGDPLNLRSNGAKYGGEVLQGNGVYHLVQVTGTDR